MLMSIQLWSPMVHAQKDGPEIMLEWDTFRAIQRGHVRHGKGTWKQNTISALRKAIIKDGAIDAGEKQALALMLSENFNFTIIDKKSKRSIKIAAKFDEASKSILKSISEDDLAFANKQRPDETLVAFLMRKGTEGEIELANLIVQDPQAGEEYSRLLALRLQAAFLSDQKKEDYDYSGTRATVARLIPVFTKLEGNHVLVHRNAVRDAFALAWGTLRPGVPLIHGEKFFNDPDRQAVEAEKVLVNLGYSQVQTDEGTVWRK